MFSFAKINSREKSLNTWFAKISSREMKKKIWKTNSRKFLLAKITSLKALPKDKPCLVRTAYWLFAVILHIWRVFRCPPPETLWMGVVSTNHKNIYIKDNQRLHIQAWGPQTYKIWWVKTQYMTSSWACENNKKNNQHILFTAVDYIKTQ